MNSNLLYQSLKLNEKKNKIDSAATGGYIFIEWWIELCLIFK